MKTAPAIPVTMPQPESLEVFFRFFRKQLPPAEPLPSKLETRIGHWVSEQALPARHLLFKPDDPPRWVHFIVDGTLTGYTLLQGQKIICRILRSGSLVVPANLLCERLGLLFIECATPCRLLSIRSSRYLKLLYTLPQVLHMHHAWQEQLEFLQLQQKTILHYKNAHEKLTWLLETWPDLTALYSNSEIASYLGISASSISHNIARVNKAILRRRPT